MKRLLFTFFFLALFLSFRASPVQAGCCAGTGCNPNDIPPFSCPPYHCATQVECDARNSVPTIPPHGCDSLGDPCCATSGGTEYCRGGLTCLGGSCHAPTCAGGTCTSPSLCTQIGGVVGPPGTCSSGVCCIPSQGSTSSPLCGEGDLGVNTAIGCLMAGDPKQLIGQLLQWGVGLGIGIAFLMIIFAGFQITTAAGDPKRVKAGQELLTSAIAGLLLIVFSLFLLNFLGVTVLGLPGFNVTFIP